MGKMVVGNWKLHYSVPESTILIEKLKKELAKIKKTEVVICPSFIDIYPASKELQKSNIKLGAQDTFYIDSGAYTGAVSASMLAHFVKYVIVGHSERRMHFGETDKMVALKAESAHANKITPIICVGETLHENNDGLSKVVVMNQLETALSHLTASEVGDSVIAYEPVWAIGTGRTCKVTEAEKMITNIRNLVKALYGEQAAEKIHIIYGGSINDETVGNFSKSNKIDGFLIGSASVDNKKFVTIVNEVEANAPAEKPSTAKVKAKK